MNSPFMDDMRMIGVEPGEERYPLSQLIEVSVIKTFGTPELVL